MKFLKMNALIFVMIPKEYIRPDVTYKEAEEFVFSVYGIKGKAEYLPSDIDQNFLIKTADSRYVFKISEANTDILYLECENLAMSYLHGSFVVPEVIKRELDSELIGVMEVRSKSYATRLISFVPGTVFANLKERSEALLTTLGEVVGKLVDSLSTFFHPAAYRKLQWDIQNGSEVIDYYQDNLEDETLKQNILRFQRLLNTKVKSVSSQLKKGIIHNDCNDYNILVNFGKMESEFSTDSSFPGFKHDAIGIVDFGDMVYSYRLCELAVTIAYTISNEKDKLKSAGYIVQGYNRVNPLTEQELASLYTFIGIRLSISISISAKQSKLDPGNKEYILIFQEQAIKSLTELSAIHPNFAEYYFRSICGLPAVPFSSKVAGYLAKQEVMPIFDFDWKSSATNGNLSKNVSRNSVRDLSIDLSVNSPQHHLIKHIASTEELHEYINSSFHKLNSKVLIGKHKEQRFSYLHDEFAIPGFPGEFRSVHLGLDLFVESGTQIYAQLPGTIVSVFNNEGKYGHGPTLILKHKIDDETSFYLRYGCLSRQSVQNVKTGQKISSGERLGIVGTFEENGNWPPHVHVQVICDLLNYKTDFPSSINPTEVELWTSLCPNPSSLFGL